jgi:transcription initiation factor TFIIB
MSDEKEDIVKCYECNSRNLGLDNERAEIFCGDCGLILEENMLEEKSHGRDKAIGGDGGDDRTHELNKVSYGLGSVVGNRNLDGRFDNTRIGRRLRYQDKTQKLKSFQRSELRGVIACRMLASNLECSENIKEQCAFTYKALQRKDKMRGIPIDVRSAGILYWVFKENGINRKIDEILDCNGAHPRQTLKFVRRLATHFKKPWLLSQRNMMGDIEKYCQSMSLNQRSIEETQRLAVPIEQMGEALCISMNAGFVAAIIYMAILCRPYGTRTQVEIADSCRITEVTLRNNYREICKNLNISIEELRNGKYSVNDIVNGAYRNE